jgi:hypothetical protein
VRVPAGIQIGFDAAEDQARGLTVSPAGVTVVPKGHRFVMEPAAEPVHVAPTHADLEAIAVR